MKVYCFFEQSGTFRDVFRELGIDADDYDIENLFGKTDHVTDLFAEIKKAYDGEKSLFDKITDKDLILAFFPCTYFTGSSNPILFSGKIAQWKNKKLSDKVGYIINRSRQRQEFYETLWKFVGIVDKKKIPTIIENPGASQGYLEYNFLKPTFIDKDRTKQGDDFKKPTAYWFFNIEPQNGNNNTLGLGGKIIRNINALNGKSRIILRSVINRNYAENFIYNYILGKRNPHAKQQCFDL